MVFRASECVVCIRYAFVCQCISRKVLLELWAIFFEKFGLGMHSLASGIGLLAHLTLTVSVHCCIAKVSEQMCRVSAHLTFGIATMSSFLQRRVRAACIDETLCVADDATVLSNDLL